MKQNEKKKSRILVLLLIVVVLALLQFIRCGLKQFCFIWVERTNYSDRVVSMTVMLFLSMMILLIAHFKKVDLSLFPREFTWIYLLFSVLFGALLIVTPIMTQQTDIRNIVLMLYGSIVTPLFEELIFRGFVWNQLESAFRKNWIAYLLSTILFALWHLGYADSLAFRIHTGLLIPLFWKAVTGFCFGVVLGGLRMKTKNCYSIMLLHGAMNLFGR